MTTQLYLADGHDQDGAYDESIQATIPFYTPATFAPSVYPHLQPGLDSHRPRIETPVATFPSAPAWPWDLRVNNSAATSGTGQVHQAAAFHSQIQGSQVKFEKLLQPTKVWEPPHWVHGTFPAAEANEDGWDRMDLSLPVSYGADSPDRASKRRQRSSTSTLEWMQSAGSMDSTTQMPSDTYAANAQDQDWVHETRPPIFSIPDYTLRALGQAPVCTEHAEASEEDFSTMAATPEDVAQTVEIPKGTPAPTFQTTAVLVPSVRIISDPRDLFPKLRRGNNAGFKTQSCNAKRGHYASNVWEGHKAVIKKMYIDEGKPLREVIRGMEKDHSFPATYVLVELRGCD